MGRRHEDPGSAEAALERVMPPERLLQRRQRAIPCQPLDGDDLGPVRLNGEEGARADGDAVEPNGARPADAVLAPDVGSGEPETTADEIGEEEARFDGLVVPAPVDGHLDLAHLTALSLASATARSTSTCTRCVRYAGDA